MYRATDTRLHRDVALKILPDAFAQDPDRLARFEREARTLAALNHPNIAQVHGLEESDGVKALVMELVEGPTLADRIVDGPIPVDEALPIATQVAEALESAHEHGIIHRDVKPANVKLRPDGTVKVLDFGLAKAIETTRPMSPGLSQSPTLTTPAMTQTGTILGTAAYMSPEQARGKPVDRRSDIWSFGCVLFEMLSGRRPFDADETTTTLARVIERKPDWAVLPPTTPGPIRRLIERCLIKDPRRRLRDVGEARLAIEDVIASPRVDAPPQAPRDSGGRWRGQFIVAAAVAGFGLASTIGWTYVVLTREPSSQPLRSVSTLVDRALINSPALRLAVSPDGKFLAYTAPNEQGMSMLWLGSLDGGTETEIPGTDGAQGPFWSPKETM